jgi:hypothetical protein
LRSCDRAEVAAHLRSRLSRVQLMLTAMRCRQTLCAHVQCGQMLLSGRPCARTCSADKCCCLTTPHAHNLQDGWTALTAAARDGKGNLVSLLIKANASCTSKTKVWRALTIALTFAFIIAIDIALTIALLLPSLLPHYYCPFCCPYCPQLAQLKAPLSCLTQALLQPVVL